MSPEAVGVLIFEQGELADLPNHTYTCEWSEKGIIEQLSALYPDVAKNVDITHLNRLDPYGWVITCTHDSFGFVGDNLAQIVANRRANKVVYVVRT